MKSKTLKVDYLSRVEGEGGLYVKLRDSAVVDVIRSDNYLAHLDQETRTAIELGAGGVPAWVIDRRLLVPGAQPREVFEKVFERLGYA